MSSQVIAQSDIGSWGGLEILAPINKKFKIGAEVQIRHDNNFGRLTNAFGAGWLNYHPNKHFIISGGYRLSALPYNTDVINLVPTHRYTADFTFKKIPDLFKEDPKLNVAIRLRATTEYEPARQTEMYLRGRIKLEHPTMAKKVTLFAAGEWFYHINNQIHYTNTEVIATHAIDKFRFKYGAYIKPAKRHRIKVFGMYQRLIMSQTNEFIVGLGYRYKFKKMIKKKVEEGK